ncbi:50S ribosomal protein LX [Salinarchaeum sp. Harcht-Bsk1]|uniref:50S ribosomal protein L18Ae n=1 Tax=Salinarchaeum sp. Harcht-Bsk1 TaxID=1333523 RepID=UPI00034234A4|nr:50S ribosomal protein L18Ae [Salinarchaeum sp. Harcht-Bsk1]AGN01530.1 50S ribosomal protein LX [Salinarchaeum sp. Harcht-Bsk1]
MSVYTVSGRFQIREGWQAFETEIEAANEDVAEEHTYSEMGSRHNLKRAQVEVEEVEAA